jgi:hypothetical protein
MSSYGKTWGVWATDQGEKLPVGAPILDWSFNRFGEAEPALVKRRDRTMGIDTERVRRSCQDLAPLAHP